MYVPMHEPLMPRQRPAAVEPVDAAAEVTEAAAVAQWSRHGG